MLMLIKNIKELREINSNQNLIEEDRSERCQKALCAINDSYQSLVKASNISGVFYKFRDYLLMLGGWIIASVLVPVGIIGGFFLGFGQDLYHLRKPTGALPAAFAGGLIAGIVGYRIPTSLNSRESKEISIYVDRIGKTFETLADSLKVDYLKDFKENALKELFHGDREAFEKYCKEMHQFEIITFPAPALSAKHKGVAGNHAVIRISINGHEKLIELGRPSDIKDFMGYKLDGVGGINQTETRKVTGEQLMMMLSLNTYHFF